MSWVDRGIAIFRAPPAGFEPATNCLEGSCSVRLSYGGPGLARYIRRRIAGRTGSHIPCHRSPEGGGNLHPRIQIGIDSRDPEALAPFWAAALGFGIGEFDDDGVYLDLVPPDTSSPVVYFQRVPEDKHVKNRVHLDLYLSDPDAKIRELLALGATRIGAPLSGAAGGWWQVMSDPEGNEFCICRED